MFKLKLHPTYASMLFLQVYNVNLYPAQQCVSSHNLSQNVILFHGSAMLYI